jgi:Cu-Zn family superoxide dismutase
MNWRWVVLAGLMLGGCATLMYGGPQATADLKNAKGEVVGTASFWEDAGGVRIIAEVRGIPPGKHGFHVHAVGKSDPPDFTTAGGHFNPGGKKHGLKSPQGPHAGSALVLHANPDDEVTDPTGNAGGRIACGLITKVAGAAGRAGY